MRTTLSELAPLPAPPASVAAGPTHPPGDLAVWFFILAELLVFAVFFAAYAFARAHDVALFNAMQEQLDRPGGALNTVLLITASWCVARAVQAVCEQNHAALGARWLAGGIACGGGFLIVKCIEYADKFAAGINLSTNTFWMFYLSLTFFHFMHVILGMVILAVLWAQTRRGIYTPGHANGLESGAAYWHMVDLVWIVLFPLVYVMR
ncbi:MAG: cytochrome c oxidase subunit 3 family protein [Rhodocyclaceae bacterium]|nr:cytochrome c oxidase subunit 3 family protein [Rhodocyclaceae bacterium]MBX3668670.1 cytochrome c oxidase subunit 3 family protein [Rhodocyclaceae bacterium]